jgi:hypothetical protein
MLVYDFASANDAALYMEDGFITMYGKGAGVYDVADVPGARGFTQEMAVNGSPAFVHGVAFTKADRFALVFTRSSVTTTPAEAKQHASTLHARL